MINNRFSVCVAVACLVLPQTLGCLIRSEHIKIVPDGTVTVSLTYEGSPEDFVTTDALPSAHSGWEVTIETEKKEGDDDKQMLSAERTFAPGAALHSNYAPTGDPDADLYLDFPTTVQVVEKADGTYYYFRRTYNPRRWGYVQYWNDAIFNDDIKKLGDKPAEDLTLADKLRIARAFAGVEAAKQIEFAKAALDECAPDLPPIQWLTARQALLDVYEKEDLDDFNNVFKRCEQVPEDQASECFDHEAERILGAGYAALTQSLRENASFNPLKLAAFERAYERAKKCFEITDEVGGHNFWIAAELPGTIIAHNGEMKEENDPRTVTWTFDGKAFRDRPHVLMAVSRVEKGTDTESKDTADGSDG